MKKFLCVIIILIMLVGCSPFEKEGSINMGRSNDAYITGVWISYTELDAMLANGDFKNQFSRALSDCKGRGITDIFVHTRAFCDSVYSSQYFPLRESAQSYNFDVLEYMITECHAEDIKFHAWINPYRVRTADTDINNLPTDSIVRKWLEDDNTANDTNVCFSDGVYLNPASSEARALILDGIREIIDNYAVDGIHFDDYFYPTQDEAFDAASYTVYCQGTQKPLKSDEWRRANVNALISGVYTAIKFKNKDIVFSVSPSASIDENYNKHYADIAAWVDNTCVDYIIPQLYFGFEYPDSDFKFNNLLSEWQKEIGGTEVKLLIGLATYKIDTQNEPDRLEWSNGTEVIKQQVQICEQADGIAGHIYFSYSSMCEYL